MEFKMEHKSTYMNRQSNMVVHSFTSDPERSRYDWDGKKGWEQYDTNQDAWYFGIWVNKKTRQIRQYMEGDFYEITCFSIKTFNVEIQVMNEFYEDGFIAQTMDADGTWTTIIQDREQFFIREEAVSA